MIEGRKEVVEVVEVSTYILEMDKEHAQLLFDITGRIGGDPYESRRALVDELRSALHALGLRMEGHGADDIGSSMSFTRK